MSFLRLTLLVGLAGLLVGCGSKENDSASKDVKKTDSELQTAKAASEKDAADQPKTKPQERPKPVVDPPVVDDRILDGKKAQKLEVRHSMIGFRNTLLFYTFKDQQAILTLTIGNTDETFPVKGKIHLFDDATTEEGLNKWINNQHSDGLFPEVPTPTFTGELPEGSCKVTSHKQTGTSENPSPVSPATFKNYEVKLSVKEQVFDTKAKLSAFTDTALVHVKSEAGEVTAGAKAVEVDAAPASDVEIKQDGEWKPAKLPLAGLAEGKAVEVKVRGTLSHGIMAIGGETTGTIIGFGKTTWELDLQKDPAFRSAAEKLNGKRVVVTGTVREKAGIEIAKRTIMTIESIDSAED